MIASSYGWRIFFFGAVALMVFSFPGRIFAASATWTGATSGDWNTDSNWNPAAQPNGASDTATFASSSRTSVSLSADTTVDGIVFNAGASAFTIAALSFFGLTIDGAGITNNSSTVENFTTAFDGLNESFIFFSNVGAGTPTISSPGGGAVIFTNNLGATMFNSGTNAGSGTFINNGRPDNSSAITGETDFNGTANAGSGTFTNNGGTGSGGLGGFTNFLGTSDAVTGMFTSNGATVNGALGGVTNFGSGSTANAATLIANGGSNGGLGGTITFSTISTGGTATVKVFGNGSLDISGHTGNALGVTIGSLEGTGNVFLGSQKLTVGSNNSSTTFSGVIQDGGSLSKIGTGQLSLTNANTFTGGTLISAGTLVAGSDGALGTGNVSLTASGVTLTLQSGATNNYISDNSSISIVTGATANLNFTGTSDIVGGIVLNGVIQTAPGTYGSSVSGATFQSAFFSGTGTLTLVPEPSTSAMIGVGAAVLVGLQRIRRKRR